MATRLARFLQPLPERDDASARERRRLRVLRYVLVASQAATIVISWKLWLSRTDPPVLPAVGWLPSLDMGVPLLASLAFVLRFPLVGAVVHAVLLALSFGMDQSRLQPEVVSMAILLFASTGRPNFLLVGRAHLVTLWFWAGLSKLLSPNFYSDTGPWMFDGLPLPAFLDPLGAHFGAVVIVLEMGAGLLALAVRTRRLSAAFAIAVHAGALVALSPIGHNWNEVIWPWNVALPVAAVTLIAPWTESVRNAVTGARWPMRIAVLCMAVYPIGYYAGAVDAYLSHHLYSADTPSGEVCDVDGECRSLVAVTIEGVSAPLPPEHRLFRALFDKTCEAGEKLYITDERRWYAMRNWESIRPC